MLKGERTRLQRYAIESTPARVYEGCCTWFTILVLSATGSNPTRKRRVVLLSGRAELARAQARRQNNQPGRRPWAALRLQAPRRGIEIAPAPGRRNPSSPPLFWQKPLLNALRGGFFVFGVQKNAPKMHQSVTGLICTPKVGHKDKVDEKE